MIWYWYMSWVMSIVTTSRLVRHRVAPHGVRHCHVQWDEWRGGHVGAHCECRGGSGTTPWELGAWEKPWRSAKKRSPHLSGLMLALKTIRIYSLHVYIITGYILSGWCFGTCFIYPCLWEEESQLICLAKEREIGSYFSEGFKPPTRKGGRPIFLWG